jgi:hypothetical protein
MHRRRVRVRLDESPGGTAATAAAHRDEVYQPLVTSATPFSP